MKEPVTRKTLVRLIGGDMTVDRLRKNEDRWSLSTCRIKTGNRSVLLDKQKALAKLRAL